jgi:hypothetical protein
MIMATILTRIRSLLRDTGWQDAPFSNQMRRRIAGKWEYRPKTPAEEWDFESRNGW